MIRFRRLLFGAVVGSCALSVTAPASSANAGIIPSLADRAFTSRFDLDVIRGRIVGPDNQPIARATVVATSLSGSVRRAARTDDDGRFTITFPNGEGDYLIAVTALGYTLKRFELKRLGDEAVLLANAKLDRAAVVLDRVTVDAPRDRPARQDVLAPDIGGTERPVEGMAVPADQFGDLIAMAASLPGVQLLGDGSGFSVLGLGGDQNSTMLNGMGFGGDNLPRDAAVSASLAIAPYDVSRGGFSGGQLDLRTRPGSNFVTRTSSLALNAPQLQWTDEAGRALGQRYANASLGGAATGPLVDDEAFYNVAYQLGRRSSDLQSLLNTSPIGLRAAGVAADSVGRLLGLLEDAGVPGIQRQPSGSRFSDQGSVLGAFDLMPSSSESGQAFNLTVNGAWNRQTPVGALATELPQHGGDRTSWNGTVQGRHSNYYRDFILSETSLAFNSRHVESSPFLELPSGQVRVSSDLSDGTQGVQELYFGGNPYLRSRSAGNTLGLTNQLSWFSLDNRHRLKLTTELRADHARQEEEANLLGTFTFNSLADLAANQPSSFTRLLTPREASIGQLVGGMSLGDAFRVTRDLQLQYGVRADASRYQDHPRENPGVRQLFGTQSNDLPGGVFFSPRLGFSWTYGQAPEVAAFAGAARAPRAALRGGIGVFQNVLQTGAVASSYENTGLADAVQQVTCVGPATPIPAWTSYGAGTSAVPTTCANGPAGFADAASAVVLFAPGFAPQRSLRSNLQWNGPVLGNRLTLTVETTYSRNEHQASVLDRNFDPDVNFTLPGEGGRPVFVPTGSIDPISGSVAASASRVSPVFSRVSEQRSDMRSDSRQLLIGLAPVQFSSSLSWSASYVLFDGRERTRGFESTAGNPLDVDWTRTATPRHQITYALGYNLLDVVRLNWFGRVQSGLRFTPLVGGDVNGDGYANDRAFVFNPAQASNSVSAAAMRSLLATGSAGVRDCLTRQLGTVAARNSCEAPWTASAVLGIALNPVKLHIPQRASITFQVNNPLAAADLLLHGDAKLHGWGQAALPDRTLLYVRGFDPGAKEYRYEMNQRFGATRAQSTAFRIPVTLTALVRVDIGPSRERQLLTQQLDKGRRRDGDKVSEFVLMTLYGTNGGIVNPLAVILRQQDTLKLTSTQADSLASMNYRYVTTLESLWGPLSAKLAALPNDYDRDEAYQAYQAARRGTIDALRAITPSVRSLLTAGQLRQLPAFVVMYLDTRYLASIRSGTSSAGSGVMVGDAGFSEFRGR